MVVVIRRWPEPRFSPTINSGPLDHELQIAVVPVNTCGGAALEDAGVLGDQPVL